MDKSETDNELEYAPETETAEQFLRQQHPSAVGFFRVKGVKEKQLGNLALHHRDLLYSTHCLASLKRVDDDPVGDDHHIGLMQESLWRGAVIYFVKCFGHNASRSTLNHTRIFLTQDRKTRFKFFSSLRDKHLVHDENAYTNYSVVLVINPEPSGEKIAAVGCLRSTSFVRTAERVAELYDLVDVTRRWVRVEMDKLKASIKADYESKTRMELLSLEKIRIAPVLWSDVHGRRQK